MNLVGTRHERVKGKNNDFVCSCFQDSLLNLFIFLSLLSDFSALTAEEQLLSIVGTPSFLRGNEIGRRVSKVDAG